MSWPTEELEKIAETDDLHISPFRDDRTTYGTPTWIWSVVVDGALYVATTGKPRVGIRPLCDRRRDGLPPPA
jgi:hypothetical protein